MKRFAMATIAAVSCFGVMLVAVPVLSGAASAADLSAAAPQYQLGPDDRIRLTVFGEPNLSGEFAIDGSGGVAVPLIGKVRARGLTASELADRIADKLSPDYLKDPDVTVEVLTNRPFYIVGEVKRPGSYPYVNDMSVINAVALAGGFTYRAREENFYIDRAVEGGTKQIDAKRGTRVLPGDVITVRERFF